MTAANRQN